MVEERRSFRKFLCLLLTVVSNLIIGCTNVYADGPHCIVCDELSDPKHYQVGAMKSMVKVAPGRDKWLFRSEVDLSNDFGIPPEYYNEFKRLAGTFEKHGVELVVAVQPTRGLMHRDKVLPQYNYGFNYKRAHNNFIAFLQQLKEAGVIVPPVQTLVSNPPREEYFFRRDHHWTPYGARLTAEIVANEIKSSPRYNELEKVEFDTEKSIKIPKDGTMNRALNKICGNNYGSQYVQGYQTFRKDTDSSALFGDESVAPVVLVGTSNSAVRDNDYKNYNYEGFLKQYLSLDILNYALAGGGQEGALLKYLLSEDYLQGEKPAFIIWELPASYRLDDGKIYRQIIPAINRGCNLPAGRKLHKKTMLKIIKPETRIEILSNSGVGRKKIRSGDYFLDLKMSNKLLKNFYVIVYYDNGLRDKVWFRRYDVLDGGQYYLELSKKPRFANQNILSVFIEPTQELEEGTNIEVNLCENR